MRPHFIYARDTFAVVALIAVTGRQRHGDVGEHPSRVTSRCFEILLHRALDQPEELLAELAGANGDLHAQVEGLVRDDGAESVTGRIRNVCDCDADDCGSSLCPRTKMAKWLCSQRAIGIRGFGLSALGSTARRRGATWRARSQ